VTDVAQSDLQRVERAVQKMKAAQEERDVVIVLAYKAGETMADIARRAGLTRGRVSQIIKQRG
jgi:DNA-directed RNA polymerase specialized sigma subunit